MAKALIGHLPVTSGDIQVNRRLAADNARLRSRVLDLEALVTRLQRENDELAARLLEPALERMQRA